METTGCSKSPSVGVCPRNTRGCVPGVVESDARRFSEDDVPSSSRRSNAAAGPRRLEPSGRMGVARWIRCRSSSAMSHIASSSLLVCTSQAPCAQPRVLLGQTPSPSERSPRNVLQYVRRLSDQERWLGIQVAFSAIGADHTDWARSHDWEYLAFRLSTVTSDGFDALILCGMVKIKRTTSKPFPMGQRYMYGPGAQVRKLDREKHGIGTSKVP